jgi:hypothetical protein
VHTDYDIKQTQTEPYSPWQNRCESMIKELKKETLHLMNKTRTPKVLWDYCISFVAERMSLTASDLFALHGRTPHELVTGFTHDISKFVDYTWYEPLWFYTDVSFPHDKRELDHWLGIAH